MAFRLTAGANGIRTAGPPSRVDVSSAMPQEAKTGSLDSAAPQPHLCLHPLNVDICFAISNFDPELTPLDAGYGSAILDPNADREIVPIDIERDFDILPVQVRSRWIVKPRDFATRHNQAAHRLAIAALPSSRLRRWIAQTSSSSVRSTPLSPMAIRAI